MYQVLQCNEFIRVILLIIIRMTAHVIVIVIVIMHA